MSQSPNSRFVAKVMLRQSISSVRLVIALFTIGSAAIKLVYNNFLPGLKDLDTLRWTIIGLGCVFFVTTFIPNKRGLIVTYFSFFLYLLTLLYVIAFVAINQFNPNAVTILILVVGASTIVFNNLLYYGFQAAIIAMASLFVFLSYDLNNDNLIALVNLMIALGTFGIVVAVRLRLVSSVQTSYSNLEKLNVLSVVANKAGEIVFVSPSAEHVLGYRPDELLRDGWWQLGNLQEAWIDRNYIFNYPNIMPKEIETMETTFTTKAGQPISLSWANSILPNGNYLGLALDITKYKRQNSTVDHLISK